MFVSINLSKSNLYHTDNLGIYRSSSASPFYSQQYFQRFPYQHIQTHNILLTITKYSIIQINLIYLTTPREYLQFWAVLNHSIMNILVHKCLCITEYILYRNIMILVKFSISSVQFIYQLFRVHVNPFYIPIISLSLSPTSLELGSQDSQEMKGIMFTDIKRENRDPEFCNMH